MSTITLESNISCPICGHESAESMPSDACQFFWQCPNCDEILKPDIEDCCVYCSFGDNPCPPIQQEKDCCQH